MNCNCCEHCADFCPYITLEQWREILCFNPYYFWQMAQNKIEHPRTPIPLDEMNPCGTMVYESCYQGGKTVGRNEIWQAIERASELLRTQFVRRNGYYPTPTNTCEEITFRKSWSGCGHIRTKYARVMTLGKQVEKFVETVTISSTDITDENGDGVLDTITFQLSQEIDDLVIKLHGYDDCRFVLYDTKVDGKTVSFRSWQALKPEIFQNFFSEFIVEPNDPDNYVMAFDIYKHRIKKSDAITVFRRPDRTCCQDDDDCFTCEAGDGCLISNDRGIIEIDLRDQCGCLKCLDRVCVNYVSGDCLDVASIIARLAAAMIGRDLCCNPSTELQYWQGDFVGLTDKGRIVTTLDSLERQNPFGTRRGQLDAFSFIRSFSRRTKAVRI